MNQGPNLMNLRYVAELLTAGSIGSLRLRKDLNQCILHDSNLNWAVSSSNSLNSAPG